MGAIHKTSMNLQLMKLFNKPVSLIRIIFHELFCLQTNENLLESLDQKHCSVRIHMSLTTIGQTTGFQVIQTVQLIIN